MARRYAWLLRATVAALVVMGAGFVSLGWTPGTTGAQARVSSESVTTTRQVRGRVTPTKTATKTPTKTATSTKTSTATRTTTATKTATSTSTTPSGANEGACLNTQEAAFLVDINNYRKSKGLGPLVATKSLNVASYGHSLDMGQHKYFAHNSQDGTTPWERMYDAGYTYATTMGENIAAGYSSADSVFTAWKNSPDHNANMLNPNFKAIGIGQAVVSGSPYGAYWTTDFGGVVDAQSGC